MHMNGTRSANTDRMQLLVFTVLVSIAVAQDTTKPAAPQTSTETSIKGKLVDAQCHVEPEWRVSKNTNEFGKSWPDRTCLKFDEGGNEKVRKFLQESSKGRQLLEAEEGKAKRVTVRASGTRTSDTFNLESIRF